MNPHFSFNTMNSIQYFILENKPDEALDFISRYSKLVRMILYNSSEEKISVQQELEALKLYLEIEQMRLDNKFSYEIIVSDDINPNYQRMPSMILQPYVENAIWHGISNKKNNGKIIVGIKLSKRGLICYVEDDGIGRAKAEEIKSNYKTKHKSFGMDITKERLRLMNNTFNENMGVTIIDLKDEDNRAIGTRIEIKIG